MFNLMLAGLILFSGSALFGSYSDRTFYSERFKENRTFRVWFGDDFDSSGVTRYSVIYYCHGCGGSHTGDSYGSYEDDGSYLPPICSSGCAYPLSKPFNADFQDFTNKNRVLIVMIDGRTPSGGGCGGVWYPGLALSNEYRFGLHFREIIRVVDSLYPTMADPQHRAVSGLSMGGHSALWIAAQNPHYIRSLSSFCHSPIRFGTGAAAYMTPVDIMQLWRNFRGVSTRTTANKGDYIYAPSRELAVSLEGGALENEYHLTSFFRHWAFHIDSQFAFHARTFTEPRDTPACFSMVNLYPDFDAWGYSVASGKTDTGWIYLKDVSKSGFACLTRRVLPYGAPSGNFPIRVTTPGLYLPQGAYTLTKYDYRDGSFTDSSVSADSSGRITVALNGGSGAEFGISGVGLPAPLVLLTDPFCEDLCVPAGRDTAIFGTVANLGPVDIVSATMIVSSATSTVGVKYGSRRLLRIPAHTVKRVDTIAVLRGETETDPTETQVVGFPQENGYGFVRIQFAGNPVDGDKEHLLRVQVMPEVQAVDSYDVKIMDGRGELLTTLHGSTGNYSYNVVTSDYIEEGTGNGDGKIDTGEVFSIWIRLRSGWAPGDAETWHPVIPLNAGNPPGVRFVTQKEYLWSRTRALVSALVKLTAPLSDSLPVDLLLRTELMQSFSGGQKGRDASVYRYLKLRLPLHNAISVENGMNGLQSDFVSIRPNPFTSSTSVRFRLSGPSKDAPVLTVTDIQGRTVLTDNGVRLRVNHEANAGRFDWNGRNSANQRVAAGLYIVTIRNASKAISRRLLLLP